VKVYLYILMLGSLFLSGCEQNYQSVTSPIEQSSQLTESDEEAFELIADFIQKPFRIKDTITVRIPGTEESQFIERQTKTVHKLVFQNRDNFRVRRQLPFNHSIYEFLKVNGKMYSMTPSNRRVEPSEAVPEKTWVEVVASPLRLAQRWGLASYDYSITDWIKRLKSQEEPIKNLRGDEVVLKIIEEEGAPPVLAITSKGTILHDNKTLVAIESTWELTEIDVSTADLEKTLMMRSVHNLISHD